MLEEKHGPVEAVAMEVDGALIITPIFKKETVVQEGNLAGVSTIKPVLEKSATEASCE